MAKRRKTKKTRRRRVGALSFAPTSPLVKFGSILVGYLMAKTINDPINNLTKSINLDGKVIAAAEGVSGYLLAFGPGKKSLLKSLGGGILIGAGAKRIMDSMKTATVTGYGRVPVIGTQRGRGLAGYHSVPVLGSRPTSVNGYESNGMVGMYNSNPKPFSSVMAGVDQAGSGSGITNTSGGGCMA